MLKDIEALITWARK